MYTAASAFFEAIWDAGITHCFVNLGSDHPGIMEAIVHGQKTCPQKFPRIITCPNEMVAMSMADGFARTSGQPQCVLVHVDVGTQALGQALHNASCGRAPVLIFAGLSPHTLEGELPGSRTEYIHWLQDVPDQKAIVAQYCRYTGEIRRGANVKQMVNRALSFARSDPQGPVYLTAAREALEEAIEPYEVDQGVWGPVELGVLPAKRVGDVAEGLVGARMPLVITGYSGRNHAAVGALVELADTVKGLRVLETGGSDLCFPGDHPAALGLRYGIHDAIKAADVILIIDCDVPWIYTQCHPKADTKVFHIDVDPLKQQMPLFYVNSNARFRADAETSIRQITEYIKRNMREKVSTQAFEQRWTQMEQEYKSRLENIASMAVPHEDGTYDCSYLISQVRKACPLDTIWAIEAVTNTFFVSDQIRATEPGSWINCGGGGLGWSGGGALGVKLATDALAGGKNKGKFVCQIVGDGCFMFSVPSSVYWISRRYDIPILTVVLNNKGWNAPRNSLLLVHPNGEGSKVSNKELNISFEPTPDYAGIAKAASGGICWAGEASNVDQLAKILPEAVAAVKGGISAVINARIERWSSKHHEESVAQIG